ncbi:MAG: cupin domain-containing protein [Opitutaceae bacterium]|nr:cupin domain-containing protein [Opitutaceae bacterium]
MKITRAADLVSNRGPAAYFTGVVRVDELAGAAAPGSAVRVVRVAFEPGARTAWHTHPHGQILQILNGVARVQRAGEPLLEVQAGDAVWFEPGERHWHGAAPGGPMVHLAVQLADAAGQNVTWLDHVTDAEYGA